MPYAQTKRYESNAADSQQVPPTNGWMVELGYAASAGSEEGFNCGYRWAKFLLNGKPLTMHRIYISGDTLLVDELKEIPERYRGQNIDLMLIHLGGTTIPSPSVPLLMVTMDAKQGLELVRLINPDITIPIHYEYAKNCPQKLAGEPGAD